MNFSSPIFLNSFMVGGYKDQLSIYYSYKWSLEQTSNTVYVTEGSRKSNIYTYMCERSYRVSSSTIRNEYSELLLFKLPLMNSNSR